MYIRIPGTKYALNLKVELHAEVVNGHPLGWPKRLQLELAQEIKGLIGGQRFAPSGELIHFPNGKIGACKACRFLLRGMGHKGSLKEAKEFVDAVFNSNLEIIEI